MSELKYVNQQNADNVMRQRALEQSVQGLVDNNKVANETFKEVGTNLSILKNSILSLFERLVSQNRKLVLLAAWNIALTAGVVYALLFVG